VSAAYALGVDIGGTFTDIVLLDEATGARWVRKVRTTPDHPERAVLDGVEALCREEGIPAADIDRTNHATTLFTNALIERKGARTGLVTTAGFRDILEIGRERKYELYNLFLTMPAPLVPRPLRVEVGERRDERGAVLTPLDEDELLARVGELAAAEVDSLAVVFLHAYADAGHEERAAELIRAHHRGLFVSTSAEVAPEIREYERASTTVANAYVRPLAEAYLDRLVGGVAALGTEAPFFMMLSSGGLTSLDEARRLPVRMLESGPAAGALAGALFGRAADADRLIALDMGGTTAKACIVDDAEPMVANSFEAAREARFKPGSGLPINIATIDLIEIGAGGGSIASLSRFGTLRVGPESAGAVPGPACYGSGGTLPTVTDADLVLGYLDPDFFLGGSMAIDLEAARTALATLGEQAGLDAVETAWGIHDIVNENMAGAARVHLAERGKEPRAYDLLATGGAGPVHAFEVARKLGCRRLICPPAAGVGSTLGLLMAPARADRVASLIGRLDDLDMDAVATGFAALEADARAAVAAARADPGTVGVRRFADMNFVGQGSELTVELPADALDAAGDRLRAILAASFDAAYRDTFGQAPRDVPVQVLHLRVRVQSAASTAALDRAASDDRPWRKGERRVYFAGAGFVAAQVLDRAALPAGVELEGPAVVEEPESTLVIGPGARFRRDAAGNVVVDLPRAEEA